MFKYLMNIVHADYEGPLPPTTGEYTDIGGLYEFLKTGLNWFFGFAILLAIIILIASGIQWMTAGGNDDSRKSAISRIYYVIAGVGIIFLAWIVVTQIIPQFLGVDIATP
jgi:hypothetical protein